MNKEIREMIVCAKKKMDRCMDDLNDARNALRWASESFEESKEYVISAMNKAHEIRDEEELSEEERGDLLDEIEALESMLYVVRRICYELDDAESDVGYTESDVSYVMDDYFEDINYWEE